MKRTKLQLLGLCLALSAGIDSSAATPKHQYTFNDGFGSLIAEDSLGGAHGTLIHNTGAARLEDGQWKTGNDGTQQVQRENGDYVDLPNGMISALGDNATFEFWVTWRGGALWTHMYDFGISDSLIEDIPTQGTMTSWFMMSPAAKSTIAISRSVLNGSSAAAPEGVVDADAEAALPVDEETHVTVVINGDANTNELYVNGSLVASAAVAGKLSDLNDVNNWIGQSSWGGDRHFNGDYNEVRFYDSALSADEVAASFNAGPVPASGNSPITVPGGPDHLDPTKTRVAQLVRQEPVIDGEIDDADWFPRSDTNWSIIRDPGLIEGIPGQAPFDVIRGGKLNGDVLEADEDFDDDLNVTDIRVGYDDTYLYVAAAIQDFDAQSDSAAADSEDQQTWQDDSVEIFIDGNNSNFPNRSTNGESDVVDTGGQFVIARNNAYREKEAGDPGYGPNDLWFAKAAENEEGDGYQIEARIALSILGNPKPGDVIGFNLSINDDDDGDTADSSVIWTGSVHSEYSYGNVVLGGKSYTAPLAGSPTIDGAIDSSEYATAKEIVINRHTGIYNLGPGDDKWPFDDMRASAYVIHDAEAVYVAVNVIDDQIFTDSAEPGSEDGSTWIDDSVEIFFDPDNSDGPGAGIDNGRGDQEFEGQFVLTANGAFRDNEANNPKFGESGDWFAATQLTDTGYQVEFRVAKSALLDPSEGTLMGFNIALNDDDGANRKNQLNWSGQAHQESSYGDLILGGEGSAPPTSGGPAGELGITLKDNGTATVTWTSGTLQWTTDLSDSANWTNVTGAAGGSYDADVNSESTLFFRTTE